MPSLRHRVQIQTPVTIQDSYGDPQVDYVTLASASSFVRATTGTEKIIAARLNSETDFAVDMRYNPDQPLDASMRFLFTDHYLNQTRILNIVNIVPDPFRHLQTVYCKNVTPPPNPIRILGGNRLLTRGF